MRTRIIIFSSTEKLSFAKAIQRNLFHTTYEVKVWTDGFFAFSQSYISSFNGMKKDYDYAIVICGKDDKTKRRGKPVMLPRDNVLLELGMCISSMSLAHTIIVKEEGAILPTDIDGITPITYIADDSIDIDAVAGTICSKIESHIKQQANGRLHGKIPWDEYYSQMKELVEILQQSPRSGGYLYDAIVAINRGGLMVADMISRERNMDVPIIPLFPDRRNSVPNYDATISGINNSAFALLLDASNFQNILLVDSLSRKGDTIIEGKAYLQKLLPKKTVKSLVVYANSSLKGTRYEKQIDFVGAYRQLDGMKLQLT